MGLFESANSEVRALRGLHLYHFSLSNCSQRVTARPGFGRAVASYREKT